MIFSRFHRQFVLLFFGMCLLGWALPLSAGSPGSATATFLKLDPYARTAAQGSAGLGSSDVSSLHFNPAGLGFLQSTETSVTQNDLFAGITYRNASLVHSIGNHSGGFGLSLTSMNFGEQNRTRISGNDPITGLGDFSANDFSFKSSYGLELHKTLSVGGGIKYVESKIAGYQDGTLSGDFGIQYRTPYPNWRFGLAGRNLFGSIGLNKRSDPLPRVYEVGGNYFWTLFEDAHEFEFGFGTGVSNDSNGYFFGGMGYELYNTGTLRLGYHGAQDAGDGVTFGAGFHYSGVQVDYAYVPFGDLGRHQRFSLSYRFGGSGRTKEPIQVREETEVGHVRTSNKNKEGWLDQARRLYRAGSYEDSYKILRELHQESPDSVDVLLWMGLVEHKFGEHESAIERMGRVLELDPGNKFAQKNLKKLRQN